MTGGGPRIPPLGPPSDPSIKTMLNKWMPPEDVFVSTKKERNNGR
jgi:hypothetical protein